MPEIPSGGGVAVVGEDQVIVHQEPTQEFGSVCQVTPTYQSHEVISEVALGHIDEAIVITTTVPIHEELDDQGSADA